jgi:TP901 family phage tail tape measure protein
VAAVSVGELEATIRLRDQLSAELKKTVSSIEMAGRHIKQIGEEMRTTGTAMTTAFTAPLGIAATAAFKFGKDFEAAMVRVQNLSDISADRVAGMRQEILELGPAVGKGPEELARGLLVVTSTGLRGAEAMEILKSSAQLSAIGLGEVNQVARAVTAGMVAYGKENLTAAAAADKLFVAVVEGGAEATEFAHSLGRVVGVASQVGVSFDEVVASVATFTRVGVDADEAVTALRQTMMLMLHPSQQARKQLMELGTSIDEVRDSIKEKGLAEALIDLVKLTEGNYDAIGAIIPNVRALAGILANAGSQADAYRMILDKVTNSQGRADAAFVETAKTLDFRWNQVLAKMQVAIVELAEKLAPSFDKMVDIASRLIDKLMGLVEWFGKLPAPIQEAALGMSALLIAAGPLAFTLGNITYALGGIISLFGKLGGAALLGPGGLVAALGLVGAGAALANFNVQLGNLEKEGSDKLKKLGESAKFSMDRMRELGAETGPAGQAVVINWANVLGEAGKAAADTAKPVRGLSEEVKKMMESLGANAAADLNTLRQAWNALTPAQRANKAIIENLADEYEELRKLVAPDKLPNDLENVFQKFVKMKAAEANVKSMADALKDVQAAFVAAEKTAREDSSKGLQKNLDATAKAYAENYDLIMKMSSDAYGYQLHQIQQEATARMDALDSTAAGYDEAMSAIRDVTGTRMEEASRIWREKLAEMLTQTSTLGTIFGRAISSIPELLSKAFTGGGGVGGAFKALLSNLGADLGEKMFSAGGILNSLGNKMTSGLTSVFGKSFGAAFGAALPGIGAAIGALAGPIISLFGKLFGDAEKKKVDEMRQKWIDSAGGWEEINKMAQRAGMTLDRVLNARTVKDYEAALKELEEQYEDVNDALERFGLTWTSFMDSGRRMSAFRETLTDIVDDMRALEQAGYDTSGIFSQLATEVGPILEQAFDAGILEPFLQQLVDAGLLTEDVAAKLLKFGQDGVIDYQALIAMAGDYGIELEHLGTQFQKAAVHDTAMQILDDFEALTGAGADVGAVLNGMSDEVQGFINDALKYGVSIPNALQPLIQQMMDAGLLVDENGDKLTDLSKLTFADSPLEGGIEDLEAAIRDLIAALGGVPGAINAIGNTPVPTVTIPVQYYVPDLPNLPGSGSDYNTYHGGGMVERMHQGLNFIRAHSGLMVDEVPAILQTGEAVLNRRATSELGSSMISSLNGGSSLSGEGEHGEGFNHILSTLIGIRDDIARQNAEAPQRTARLVREAVQTIPRTRR